MKEFILNPNCSEVVWRLNEGSGEEITTSDSGSCLDECIDELKVAVSHGHNIDDLAIDFVDTDNGSPSVVRESWNLAKLYLKGKLTIKEAKWLQDKLDNGDELNEDFFFCEETE